MHAWKAKKNSPPKCHLVRFTLYTNSFLSNAQLRAKFFSIVYIYAAPFLFFAPYMFHPTYTSFLVVVVIISLSANIDINKSNQSG